MTAEASKTTQLIELDGRRRTTIRPGRHNRYRVQELENGTLILEPVLVLTEDELILRQNPDLEARIERSMRDPATRTRRERPTK
jgi:hypothetical protein